MPRQWVGEGVVLAGLFVKAVVFGVAIVRVKVLMPGGSVGGLNEAVARFGRPVAARVMALERLPCI